MACNKCKASIRRKLADAARSAGSLAKSLASGSASTETLKARYKICEECDKTDENGKKLFRTVKGRFYCGQPRVQKLLRDSSRAGCGCPLAVKWAYKASKCPLGKW